jgi:hypothetical protein
MNNEKTETNFAHLGSYYDASGFFPGDAWLESQLEYRLSLWVFHGFVRLSVEC